MRAKRTREEWAALVAELETSGESVERFCVKHRLERAPEVVALATPKRASGESHRAE
jgi:hypothetical protein